MAGASAPALQRGYTCGKTGPERCPMTWRTLARRLAYRAAQDQRRITMDSAGRKPDSPGWLADLEGDFPILVDTSALINGVQDPKTPELAELCSVTRAVLTYLAVENRTVWCAPVAAEFLEGVCRQPDGRLVLRVPAPATGGRRDVLSVSSFVLLPALEAEPPPEDEVEELAARVSARCPDMGETDLTVLATALERSLALLHSDCDFNCAAAALGLVAKRLRGSPDPGLWLIFTD